jgi:hypothetical protein
MLATLGIKLVKKLQFIAIAICVTSYSQARVCLQVYSQTKLEI